MPCNWGSECGMMHVTATSPSDVVWAVVLITAAYVVTVELAAGAVIVMLTSGVVNVPGEAFGVLSVTVVVELTVPFGFPMFPGFVVPTPVRVKVVVDGTVAMT